MWSFIPLFFSKFVCVVYIVVTCLLNNHLKYKYIFTKNIFLIWILALWIFGYVAPRFLVMRNWTRANNLLLFSRKRTIIYNNLMSFGVWLPLLSSIFSKLKNFLRFSELIKAFWLGCGRNEVKMQNFLK